MGKGKGKQKGHDKQNQGKQKGKKDQKEQQKGNKNSGYISSCKEFKFINEERVRNFFNNKTCMKALSSKNPLSKNEIKNLKSIHPLVNWYNPTNLSLCLVCGQALDEKHFAEHMEDKHVLALSINDQTIYCTKCNRYIPIEKGTLLAELLNIEQPETKPVVSAAPLKSGLMARGLHNLGNSCWMNSSLQLLSRLPLLPDEVNGSKAPLAQAFKYLSTDLKNSGHAIKPGQFVSALLARLPFLSVTEQQDAYEFFTLFFDSLRDEMGGNAKDLSGNDIENVKKIDTTTIDKSVSFILDSEMRCETCNSVTHIYQRTTAISLCVPYGASTTLGEVLDSYFSESSSGDDWKCDTCGNTTRCAIIPHIATTPQFFILHLARFRFRNNGFIKNNIKVELPLEISLDKYGIDEKYSLFGFVTHYGTMESGHYTSVYHDKTGFVYFDDESVSSIAEQEALNIQPYIIIYKLDVHA
ncbi:Clan CA, family C19, ubiquitin hydrolase-like cysteine peptidase [Trichomonas vaginalis G3]|uniref:Ubiquitin carboxyl-terminal hydrolase n=1 Tax=Trichomonas vaginalis (strain ATCC PRA-98 / G3) TaxID=412133 RepID=A2G3R7_TRIV3|nr:Clan CA, family C19, ubiquitin hydrolase-like cysteine peptidase [Trichomonas vaginalis G3]|eukprot:XP_001301130.1 Clan CA, family C19, ubiquitin hydrolase-like cysteine peptidase [Trichomonas vaginalis G3]